MPGALLRRRHPQEERDDSVRDREYARGSDDQFVELPDLKLRSGPESQTVSRAVRVTVAKPFPATASGTRTVDSTRRRAGTRGYPS